MSGETMSWCREVCRSLSFTIHAWHTRRHAERWNVKRENWKRTTKQRNPKINGAEPKRVVHPNINMKRNAYFHTHSSAFQPWCRPAFKVQMQFMFADHWVNTQADRSEKHKTEQKTTIVNCRFWSMQHCLQPCAMCMHNWIAINCVRFDWQIDALLRIYRFVLGLSAHCPSLCRVCVSVCI